MTTNAKKKAEGKHAGGRPTRCTPEFTAKFVQYMRGGNYLCTVCDALGIAEQIIYEWFKKGAAGKEPYRQFTESVKRAAAEAEIETVARIRLHGQSEQEGSWQALMTFLERRYPERWGRRVSEFKTELTGRDGGPVQAVSASVDIAALVSDDDGRELLTRLADKLFLESGDAADPGEGAD